MRLFGVREERFLETKKSWSMFLALLNVRIVVLLDVEFMILQHLSQPPLGVEVQPI